MTVLARLALFFGLRTASAAAITPTRIDRGERGERELCAGTAFLGAPASPLAKLSAEEALRYFGVRQGGREA